MRLTYRWASCVALGTCLAFVACSSESGQSRGDGFGNVGNTPAAGGAAGSGMGGIPGTGGTSTTGGTGGNLFDGGSTGGTGGFVPDSGCVGEREMGEEIEVDMYVMLDSSGSMLNVAGVGPASKWDAVTQALTSFINDPRSDGLGVGLQFFPVPQAGIPFACTSHMDCGTGGPCTISACEDSMQVEFCADASDCMTGDCVPLGRCDFSGAPCLTLANCPSLFDSCILFTSGECSQATSCEVTDYSTPAVDIAALPGNSGALVGAIAGHNPAGLTPTSSSLEGAIEHARTHAMANPDHKVVVVYATDGNPTECDPTDIAQIQQIAAMGLSGTPSIETYVIGVFGASDTVGTANSNSIASSGGTNRAFIVDPAGNVTQQFLDALDQIRSGTLGCEFQIPEAPDGGTLDYRQVNVQFSDGVSGVPEAVLFVGDESNCDPTAGGWYYDTDPDVTEPTQIIACPASCTRFTSVTTALVQIEVGCETIVAPPR